VGVADQGGGAWFAILGRLQQGFQLACRTIQQVGFDAAGHVTDYIRISV
jgi:hypothetical protein